MTISFRISLICLLAFACQLDKEADPIPELPCSESLENVIFNPQPLEIVVPDGFQKMRIPEDNPTTIEGVNLGRQLFYDPILSRDGTISCSSCHQISGSMTDNRAVSTGIENRKTSRSSMSLLNIGYANKGLFWDGRSPTLEDQVLIPIEDHNEMDESWDNVEGKLRCHPSYPNLFRKAFGIKNTQEITRYLAAKAIAQFMRTLVSSGGSKYDRVERGEAFFTEDESEGFKIFMDAVPDLPDAECGHCHAPPLFTTHDFLNNGIDSAGSFIDFEDKGYGTTSGFSQDNGKFKVPTLRNIFLTAPYMHDGRFKTVEEVLEHYVAGGHVSPNRDPLIIRHDDPTNPRAYMNEEHQRQLIAFLHTLTDSAFIEDPDYADPF
jgi:cytochrome c peroxidase